MKTNKITQVILTLLVTGVALPAFANPPTGWYWGLGGGVSNAKIDEPDITTDLVASGYDVTSFDTDEHDFGSKLFAGYQFSRYFAIEGGYFDLGSFDYNAVTVPTGSRAGELEFFGWSINVVGMLPMTKRSSLLAVIGAHDSTASVDFTSTGAVNLTQTRFRQNETNVKFGVGYQYQVSDRLAFRLEAERYRMDDSVGNRGDLDLYSLNLLYLFGGSKAVAAVPMKPRAAPVVETPPTQQYCSTLALQFEIAGDDIERVNREHMLVLATFLKKYPETKALIEGHSDNVGEEADNMRLSERRAQHAVDFLVTEHGIARDRLTAIGYGETKPIADNSTDLGKQLNRRISAIINCATDIEGLEPLPARTTLVMQLEFDTNATAVAPQYREQLRDVSRYLKRHPKLIASLEGHTDNANDATAQQVSQARAQNVADYLVREFSVDRSRLNVIGYGGTRRSTYNITASERQDNRRVNIILGYPD